MSKPEARAIAGGYRYTWAAEQLQATVTRIIDDHRGGTTAEINFKVISGPNAGHLHQCRMNMMSTPTKKSLVSALRSRSIPEVEWDAIVETLCVDALRRHRLGEPIVEIGTRPGREGPAYRLDPMLPEGQPTIIFGEGGSFKSYLALLIAHLVQSGKSELGLIPKQGNVLYVDYETSADELNERALALWRGLGEDAPLGISYRFSSQSVDTDIESLQNAVNERDVDLLIVDSLGPAAGSDPNAAENIIRLFANLRALRVTCLLVDHVAKNSDHPTPFGSVYKTNLARSVWECRRVHNAGAIRIGLYHRKHNMGPLHNALGFEIEFSNDLNGRPENVSIAKFEVRDDEELAAGLPLTKRIKNVLGGGAVSEAELTDRVRAPLVDVQKRLSYLKKKVRPEVIELSGHVWGLATDIPF